MSRRLTAAWIIPTLILQCVGRGLLITPLFNTVLSHIDPDKIGMASGVLSTAQQVGGALGIAIIGVVFFDSLNPGSIDNASAYSYARHCLRVHSGRRSNRRRSALRAAVDQDIN